MKKAGLVVVLVGFLISCNQHEAKIIAAPSNPYIFVLGNAQDAGYPQAGCEKDCCQRVYKNPSHERFVTSIALIDPISNESWIFDTTPDFPKQLKLLSNHLKQSSNMPNGIFLTHAHMGHYTGLIHLGKEAMGTKKIPVYAMPIMKTYLTENGPWSQLIRLDNIGVNALYKDSTLVLNERISVRPIEVPHRDEFSETVGFVIQSNSKKALFIPDIDKWRKWDQSIVDYIKNVDVALLDATFFKEGEIKGRSMGEIPHPFVTESMDLFKNLSEADRKKVHFIHFNHTNPLLIDGSEAQIKVAENGFRIAKQEMVIEL